MEPPSYQDHWNGVLCMVLRRKMERGKCWRITNKILNIEVNDLIAWFPISAKWRSRGDWNWDILLVSKSMSWVFFICLSSRIVQENLECDARKYSTWKECPIIKERQRTAYVGSASGGDYNVEGHFLWKVRILATKGTVSVFQIFLSVLSMKLRTRT